MKSCNKCKILKPEDAFTNSPWCKVCKAEYSRSYRQKHKEQVYEFNKQYRKENKQKIAEFNRRYLKKWPEKNCALTARRHAEKLNRTPKWLTSLHLEQIEVFYSKARQLTQQTGIKFQVDHIIPLRGENISGLHVPWNLQILTAKENRQKGNRV